MKTSCAVEKVCYTLPLTETFKNQAEISIKLKDEIWNHPHFIFFSSFLLSPSFFFGFWNRYGPHLCFDVSIVAHFYTLLVLFANVTAKSIIICNERKKKERKIRTTIIVSVHIVIMMMLINYTSSEAVLLNKSIHVTTVSMPNQWYCMYSTLVMITIQYLPTDNIISPVLYQCIQHFKCGLL